jgi:TPR repeat protein
MRYFRSTIAILSLVLLLSACGGGKKPVSTQPPLAGSGSQTIESFASIEARAKKGEADAEFDLGAFYHDGENGTQKDFKLARQWFEKAAAQGEPRAQFNLGVMYYIGEGVKQDYAQAKNWFDKSAKTGNARAEFNLGVMYYRGEGMKQDYSQALQLFTMAGLQNFGEAQFNIGVMYAKAEGVKQDIGKAYSWFSLALDNGNPRAEEVMKNIERELSPDQLKVVKKMADDLKKQLLSQTAGKL